mmetsp:Transcript_24770/g.43355  ORF Transcript_24770/g.43355 Transcript_24770/m.43355 type:complete len:223 (-) Transcript_24770:167-835(-)
MITSPPSLPSLPGTMAMSSSPGMDLCSSSATAFEAAGASFITPCLISSLHVSITSMVSQSSRRCSSSYGVTASPNTYRVPSPAGVLESLVAPPPTSLYPPFFLLPIIFAANFFAASALGKSFSDFFGEAPIAPYETTVLVPSTKISQNLLEPPSVHSNLVVLEVDSTLAFLLAGSFTGSPPDFASTYPSFFLLAINFALNFSASAALLWSLWLVRGLAPIAP